MKRVILFLFVLCGIATMKAQEVIQLDEARINFALDEITIDSDLNSVKFIVNEEYTGEFHKNPIRFMKEKFNFMAFLDAVQNKDDFDEYLVTFNTRKGYLEAHYTNEGKIVSTYQNFKDILLPPAVRNQLYSNNKEWTMISNKYVASGRSDRLDREVYKIRLENGNKKKTVKIVPSSTTLIGLVNN